MSDLALCFDSPARPWVPSIPLTPFRMQVLCPGMNRPSVGLRGVGLWRLGAAQLLPSNTLPHSGLRGTTPDPGVVARAQRVQSSDGAARQLP